MASSSCLVYLVLLDQSNHTIAKYSWITDTVNCCTVFFSVQLVNIGTVRYVGTVQPSTTDGDTVLQDPAFNSKTCYVLYRYWTLVHYDLHMNYLRPSVLYDIVLTYRIVMTN